jgi:hypothetical protein
MTRAEAADVLATMAVNQPGLTDVQMDACLLAARLLRHAAEAGRRGGKRRLETMTAQRRSEIARTAALARWRRR